MSISSTVPSFHENLNEIDHLSAVLSSGKHIQMKLSSLDKEHNVKR